MRNVIAVSRLEGVSCATGSSDCIALGSDKAHDAGEILRSTNDGASWSPVSLP